MNRMLAILPVLLLALWSCGPQSPVGFDDCNSTSSSPDQRISACTRLLTAGQLSSRDRASAFHSRGLAWSEKRDYDRAIADYNEALHINPLYALAYYHRFIATRDRPGDAGSNTSRNEAPPPVANPKDAAGYNKRGIAWAGKRDYDRAIADYSEALRLNPQYQFAYYNRGIAWRNKGDYDRAIADYNEAVRLNPKDADAYNNRGLAWAYKHDYDRAIADYNDALRLNPKDAKAYSNRGNAWRTKRVYDRAIADYSEALRINPQYANAYYNRGLAWDSKRDYERAIADYNEALRINPQYVGAHNSAAWLLATAPVAAVRNGARAVELARKAAELSDSKDADILDTLAAAYAEAGNFSEAVRWQEKALAFPEFEKDQGDAARNRLDLYRKGQRYRQPLNS